MPKAEVKLVDIDGAVMSGKLRRALKRMDICWPGDEYGRGAYVYLVKSRGVVRLAKKLDEPGHYIVDDGSLYIEKKTALGYTQEVRTRELTEPTGLDEEMDLLSTKVVIEIARWVKKHGEAPTVLHVSCEDLMTLAMERLEISRDGNAWGLTISLLPKGEKLSVDKRIEL